MVMTRRDFGFQTLSSLLTFSLLETLFESEALAASVRPITVRWLNDVNQLGFDLKDRKLEQIEWQKKVEELFSKVELSQLLMLVDFDRLTKNLAYHDRGSRSIRFKFRQIEGVPTKLAWGRKIFAVKKGHSIVPHGHNNMATAFFILKGSFTGRLYDRLEDEPNHMIIKPTIDREFGLGEYSTISDFKDNVHWFEAVTEPSFIFNIHVMGLRPESKLHTGRVYIDPDGERLEGGLIRARRIDHDEANQLYG